MTPVTREAKTDHLLSPENAALVLIDFQPSLIDGTNSIDHDVLINNVTALTKAAQLFDLPIVLSTIGVGAGYQGDTVATIKDLLPGIETVDRRAVNAWEEEAFRAAIEATGRRKLIIAALWTEVCLVFPALDLIRDGYEVYAVSDSSGGTTLDAHNRGMERMVQAGVVPVTWEAVMAEIGRYGGYDMMDFVAIMQTHLPASV